MLFDDSFLTNIYCNLTKEHLFNSITVTLFQIGPSKMWIITVDAEQGYHLRARIRECDAEKLTFFAPNHKKYAFTVMPFGPVNVPEFYTCMMGTFKVEWAALFIEHMTSIAIEGAKLDGALITIKDNFIFLGEHKLYSGTRSIIDDILT